MPKEATKMRRTIIAVFCLTALQTVAGSAAAINRFGDSQARDSRLVVAEVADVQPVTQTVLINLNLAPRAAVSSTTVPVVASSTTTTTVPPKPAPRPSQSGVASWYRWKAGGCAHRDAPKGATVTVTNPQTGATATCVVNDYGPAAWTHRIIDLDATVFAQLAPLSQGLVEVTASW